MTNVNVVPVEVAPTGGAGQQGLKLGLIIAGTKAAQNDTWTVNGVRHVQMAIVADDSTGVLDAPVCAANLITLAGAQTLATTGLIVYSE